MAIYTDLFQASKGEPLRSVFSTDRTSISASTAPHCGIVKSSSVLGFNVPSKAPRDELVKGLYQWIQVKSQESLVSHLVLWAQSTTKDYIRAEHKLHSVSHLFISQVMIPQVFFFFFFLAYLYSAGTQHGNLHQAGWPILFCGPTQEPVLATANTGKTQKRFWKKWRWMDWKGRN